jgi:hypothetical protein
MSKSHRRRRYPKANRDFSAMAVVVTTTMLQFPSNWAAIAGGAERDPARADDLPLVVFEA